MIAETFLPALERIMMAMINASGEPLQLQMMTIIAKIFYMCNYVKLLPFLIEPGRLNNWVEFVVMILDF
jgi:hypothetical protein